MDFDLIERLMRMLEQSSLQELDVTEGEMRIRLSKSGKPQLAGQEDTAHPPPEQNDDMGVETGGNLLLAGLAGTFYRARSPGEAAFVEVGSRVSEGDQIAIIEAMKMFNPVEADRDGVITAILVENGSPIEAGAALFEIGPAS